MQWVASANKKIPTCRLKNYLHKIMYKDRATFKRSVEIITATGATDNGFQTVVENLPCKLSQYKDIYSNKLDRAQNITLDFRLNCDPEIEILEGDLIDVIHEGENFKLIAGTSFNYIDHKEISVRRRKEAAQR